MMKKIKQDQSEGKKTGVRESDGRNGGRISAGKESFQSEVTEVWQEKC